MYHVWTFFDRLPSSPRGTIALRTCSRPIAFVFASIHIRICCMRIAHKHHKRTYDMQIQFYEHIISLHTRSSLVCPSSKKNTPRGVLFLHDRPVPDARWTIRYASVMTLANPGDAVSAFGLFPMIMVFLQSALACHLPARVHHNLLLKSPFYTFS